MQRVIIIGLCVLGSIQAMERHNSIDKTEQLKMKLKRQIKLNNKLSKAIDKKNFEICEHLINAGADVNAFYRYTFPHLNFYYSYSFLEQAEKTGHKDIIGLLHDTGAEKTKEACAKKSRTMRLKTKIDQQLSANKLLYEAVINYDNNNYCVTSALQKGADINSLHPICSASEYDNEGLTALWFAVRNIRNMEVMKLLLKHGANPNTDCDRKRTRALFAVVDFDWFNPKKDLEERLQLLKKYGTDFKWKNSSNRSVLHFIADNNPCLIGLRFVIDHLRHKLSEQKFTNMLNEKDRYGMTPLLYACRMQKDSSYPLEKLSVLYYLLALPELLVDVQTEEGKTGLMISVDNTKGVGLLKLLIASKRCNAQLKSNEDKTAYDYAKAANNVEAMNILEDPSLFIDTARQDKDLARFDLSIFKGIR